MRKLLSILLFIAFSSVLAEGFTVFEQGGYYGIKDQTGTVTVPAVYEKLGWSNGTSQVFNGVIGFKHNNLWGLITVRNKALTEQKFYTIVPLSDSHFKASIKGKFSNRLFHGILDEKGRTQVSFNYFTIDPLGDNWLVSDFNGNSQLFGVVSRENRILVPAKYSSVSENNLLLIAEQQGRKYDLYSKSGSTLQLGLDSVRFTNNGWRAYRDGYAGYLSPTGKIIHEFVFKKIHIEDSDIKPIPFPKWKIYQADTLLLSWQCDSLSVSKNDHLIAYLNGAHHLLRKNKTLLSNHELILKEFSGYKLIVQNSKTRKWTVLEENGTPITSEYDSIQSMGEFFAAKNQMGWSLYSQQGDVKNRFPLQELKRGVSGQFIAKRNGYWGILNDHAEDITGHKYDSIIADEQAYLVSYLNMWGSMDLSGEWIIRPAYQEIFLHGNILIGRRGRGYSVFNERTLKFKTTARPIERIGPFTLMQGEDKKVGVLNSYGEMIIYPSFDNIQLVDDHLVLFDSSALTLIQKSGHVIIKPEEGYQQVAGHGEGYFLVEKEGRWGFVDDQGRLRVSNRYDSAGVFSDGMAPIQLKGKWGFIDMKENLRIQPYYEHVSAFINGLAVVHLNQKFGLVDENGSEVLELIWKSVHRLSTGNYIVQNIDNRVGLVNDVGSFILRPTYDYLEDHGDRILVSRNNAWGVLDYSGRQIFKINHESIKIVGDFTMVND